MNDAHRLEKYILYILLLVILCAALLMRVYRLEEVPAGADYDESGNWILAREIADGQTRPIFLRAYAGREAIFYWLAALSMRLLGHGLFAFRLTSALCGVAAVLMAYLLAREMFRQEGPLVRWWVPLFGAAIMAVSYWAVHVNRWGFRVNAMLPLQAATMFYLWRGLRRSHWPDLVIGGVLCGLSANTYLAIRAFPLVLLAFAAWVVLTWKADGAGGRWLRLRQVALFGAAALLAFAPLGFFFWQNPEFFSVRMSQTWVFDPEIHGGDLWGTLGRVTLEMLGDFTVRGDDSPIHNIPGQPIFGPWLGAAFYAGLLVCLWRSAWNRDARARTPYLLILIWLPVMMLPNILGARGVPHHLRGAGMMPVVYFVPALGLATLLQGARWGWERLHGGRAWDWAMPWGGGALTVLLLLAGGVWTWHRYFEVWPRGVGTYYNGSIGLRREAEYLGEWDADEVALWIGNSTYRHTAFAAFCPNYAHLKWISGATLVLPQRETRPVLYSFDYTNPLDPLLARWLPPGSLQQRDLGPDGKVGFEAYLIRPSEMPRPTAQFPAAVNLGQALRFVGYDVNAAAVSGDVLDVTLYFEVLKGENPDDLAFFAHLVDDLGFRWGGETFFCYPSAQWQAGEVMIYRLQADIAPGAPPGDYVLNVGVHSASLQARLPVLDEAGQMAGTSLAVGPFAVGAAPEPPAALPPIQQPVEVGAGNDLAFLGFDRDRGDLRPGETLALTLYWWAERAPGQDYQVQVWLAGEDGDVPLWKGDPVHGLYPFSKWGAGSFVRDRYALRLPLDVPAGDADLRLALLDEAGRPLPLADGAGWLSLGTLHVHASDRMWEPPAFAHVVGARLADKVELLGYSLDRTAAAPGETLRLTLIWRCLSEMESSWTVFTHLLDTGGQVRGQKDNPPMNGRYPTTLWVPGEVVVDEYDIVVNQDAVPGQYVIEVGMYDPQTMQRLPVFDPMGAVGDRVLLGQVQVTEDK